MALTKTPTIWISNVTVAANNKQDSGGGLDLSTAVDFAVGYTMTFNAAATLGARIDLFADPAGASSSFTIGAYDDAIDSGDIAIDAGHTVNGLIQMQRAAKFVKARIVNLDTGQSITAASLWGIIQAP
jgi:hypothetical protein